MALSQDGRMFSWGGNEYLQCGVEPGKRDVVSPMPCLPTFKVKQVACGGMHSLCLTDSGQVREGYVLGRRVRGHALGVRVVHLDRCNLSSFSSSSNVLQNA
jgi:alpha-tubulin suppressor-like RCC1 family protein